MKNIITKSIITKDIAIRNNGNRVAIIPIFVPHAGCPHDCVFCNQRRITAHSEAPTLEEIHKIVDRNLTTIHAKNHAKEDIHTEIAFFGGSFTAIDVAEQEQYLGIAKELKAVGKIDGIRISTRPDCIDDVVIARLKSYDVDLVELGAQSFDDDVLIASNRGHSTSDVACAMKRLKAAGFQTGLQLMVGLPGDTKAKSIESARRAAALSPDVARIYPVVVLKDTALADQMCDGRYIPWAELEMVDTVKEMYKILTESGANVIRVGLKSTDNIRNDSESVLSDYHPAFFELVLSEIALETMIRVIDAQNRDECCDEYCDKRFEERFEERFEDTKQHSLDKLEKRISIFVSNKSMSIAVGHKGKNRAYLKKRYPDFSIQFIEDKDLKPMVLKLDVIDVTDVLYEE